MSNKGLFLDRDGVINYDHGYVFHKDKFEFKQGIFELVNRANNAGYKVVVITNQSGIARGFYKEKVFNELTSWMINEFADNSAQINGVYYCPHHPTVGVTELTQQCRCRKPGTALFEQAAIEHDINMSASIMVGDKLSDMQASTTLGFAKNYLIASENPENMHKSVNTVENDSAKNNVINDRQIIPITKLSQIAL